MLVEDESCQSERVFPGTASSPASVSRGPRMTDGSQRSHVLNPVCRWTPVVVLNPAPGGGRESAERPIHHRATMYVWVTLASWKTFTLPSPLPDLLTCSRSPPADLNHFWLYRNCVVCYTELYSLGWDLFVITVFFFAKMIPHSIFRHVDCKICIINNLALQDSFVALALIKYY